MKYQQLILVSLILLFGLVHKVHSQMVSLPRQIDNKEMYEHASCYYMINDTLYSNLSLLCCY